MYISGTQFNVERRMRLATALAELEQYKQEAITYVDDLTFFVKYKINKEYSKVAAILQGEYDLDIFDDIVGNIYYLSLDDTGYMVLANGDNIEIEIPNSAFKTFDSTNVKFDSIDITFDAA